MYMYMYVRTWLADTPSKDARADQVAGIEVLPEPPSEKFKEEKACVPERKKGIMLHAAVYINNCKITIADDTVILHRLYKYYHYYGMSLFIP